MKKRVVVTGLGAISPIGNSVEEFEAAIKAGKSGVGPITGFDTTGFEVTIAAEVKDFESANWMDKKDARKMARFTQFAVAGAAQALTQAGLLETAPNGEGRRITGRPERTGVVLGNGIG
ncbi:MAG: beta-ketoacyl-[acyl-carrier-protein] synthase II, partial [Spirochaetaceae bacterium]|nr:beta-ketoacyl-[acyl-carrier-protein] synthase II [Spirochaetaceae bacterium]